MEPPSATKTTSAKVSLPDRSRRNRWRPSHSSSEDDSKAVSTSPGRSNSLIPVVFGFIPESCKCPSLSDLSCAVMVFFPPDVSLNVDAVTVVLQSLRASLSRRNVWAPRGCTTSDQRRGLQEARGARTGTEVKYPVSSSFKPTRSSSE